MTALALVCSVLVVLVSNGPVLSNDAARKDIRRLSWGRTGMKNTLIMCPTIPVLLKGGDTRAVQAVETLAGAGFDVDLLFWRDFSTELHADYDDGLDRKRLQDAGVRKFFGPFERLSESEDASLISLYDTVLFWVWPDIEWLDMLTDAVVHLKSINGHINVIAVVDDAGLASRMLKGGLRNKQTSFQDVENFVLSIVPTKVASADYHFPEDSSLLVEGDFDEGILEYAKVLIYQETLLYSMADVLAGINLETINFLKKVWTLPLALDLVQSSCSVT